MRQSCRPWKWEVLLIRLVRVQGRFSEAGFPAVRPQEGQGQGPIQPGVAVDTEVDNEYGAFSREQPEALRRETAGRDPTAAQRAEHESENHDVFRYWCKICLAARSPGAVHRAVKKETLEEAREGPRMFYDCYVWVQMTVLACQCWR